MPQEDLQVIAQAAEQFKWQRDEIAKDLEKALNICRDYQRILVMLQANDPNFAEVNRLLTRYKMSHETRAAGGKIYAEGQDITDHPDSIEGSVTEVEELPAGDTRELPSATEDKNYSIWDDDGETD